MGRSTGLAWGPTLRRAITSFVPLFAVCALASPAGAGVRSQPATQQAIASALSQTTGLAPSQVTSENVCGPARPGFATCDAEALVRRANHARVRPNVHGGASFTQVFPAGGRGIPSVRPAAAGGAQPEPGTPAWLQQAYDLTFLSQTRGAGDTVAIIDAGDDPAAESDLAVFRSAYGLPACTTANGCFEKVNQSGQSAPLPAPNSVWEPEESLDIDAVSALCPNCKILLVEATDASDYNLDQAVIEAANLHANQISNSWSDNELTPISGTYSFAGSAVIAATADVGYVGGVGRRVGMGGVVRLRLSSDEARVSAGRRLRGAGLLRSLRRRGSRYRSDGVRVGDGRLVAVRRHEPRHPAGRGLRGDHRRERHHSAMGLRRQRPAERPRGRHQRRLLAVHPLHLPGGRRLRRSDRGRVDLRSGGRRCAGDRRPLVRLRCQQHLHRGRRRHYRHPRLRRVPERARDHLLLAVRHHDLVWGTDRAGRHRRR